MVESTIALNTPLDQAGDELREVDLLDQLTELLDALADRAGPEVGPRRPGCPGQPLLEVLGGVGLRRGQDPAPGRELLGGQPVRVGHVGRDLDHLPGQGLLLVGGQLGEALGGLEDLPDRRPDLAEGLVVGPVEPRPPRRLDARLAAHGLGAAGAGCGVVAGVVAAGVTAAGVVAAGPARPGWAASWMRPIWNESAIFSRGR
jgi:hypothetical protein